MVIDASVIIAVIANEPERDAVLAQTRRANLIAPASVHWEISNAFSAMLRRNRTTLAAVEQALDLYADIPIRYVDIELRAALRLANELRIYAYDAYLLACAQAHRC